MQIFLIALSILIILTFVLPIFDDVFNIATIIGIAGGIVPLVIGLMWNRINIIPRNIIILIYFAGFALLFLFMLVILIKGKSVDTDKKYIIVLGCSVKGDKPSLSLVKRADVAYRYLVENKGSIAVLSGGHGPDENISEAECMLNMLIEKGVDKSRLIVEDKSTSTDENLRFSKELIDETEVAIATSEYHQLRTKIICNRYGIKPYAKSSKTKLIILPTFLLREALGIIKALI